MGSSPRGRGRQTIHLGVLAKGGFIPAWAGAPLPRRHGRVADGVHPRVGGGAIRTRRGTHRSGGSSPRGRGRPCWRDLNQVGRGFIPAWAGAPDGALCVRGHAGVHPRVGGGAYRRSIRLRLKRGSSPRGRGRQGRPDVWHAVGGFIPAWAGAPMRRFQRSRNNGVHPRVGGGASWTHVPDSCGLGSSPRGRGRLVKNQFRAIEIGFIPAWAGAPASLRHGTDYERVHPRVGGGAEPDFVSAGSEAGSSPRGRGRHIAHVCAAAMPGFIPAWAGAPPIKPALRKQPGVHPRVGGGATIKADLENSEGGSSPRGRGRLDALIVEAAARGFIPAWAGAPNPRLPNHFARGVHPRVGGGAGSALSAFIRCEGSSPRGRGRPRRPEIREHQSGFIPAWAGAPDEPKSKGRPTRVHPRVGGGAAEFGVIAFPGQGSSPRGRGRLGKHREDADALGFIPAWAGAPAHRPERSSNSRVHPRVGGGATIASSPGVNVKGSSPRGRGRLLDAEFLAIWRGFIPAWAGAPTTRLTPSPPIGVHPRVGGGAIELAYNLVLDGGSSPRGRGRHCLKPSNLLANRFIPAWAGAPPCASA